VRLSRHTAPPLGAVLALGILCAAGPGARAAQPPDPPKPKPPRHAPFRGTRIVKDKHRPRITLSKEALQRLLSTMMNGSEKLGKRIDAIGTAALARVPQAVRALKILLKRQDRIDVKVAAVWALGEIGDARAVPALLIVHGQASGPNPALRYDKKISFADAGVEMSFLDLIEHTIGQLGAPEVDRYIKVLTAPAGSYRTQAKTTTDLQRGALAVLICIGGRDYRAIAALIDVVKSPEEAYPPDFRETALLGLGRILVARAKEFEAVRARDKASERMIQLFVDVLLQLKPSKAREYVANALNFSNPDYAVTLLTRRFADNSPEPVRLRAIEALGLMRSPESVEALIWALRHEKNPQLRWRAAYGLGRVGKSAPALRELVAALKDKSPDVHRAALSSIARIGGGSRVRLIAPSLGSTDPKTRRAAARALGIARDKTAIGPLVKVLGDRDVELRCVAIAALGALPSRKSLAAIAQAVGDRNRQVRFTALNVLTKIKQPAAYAALLGLVGDIDPKIRSDAMNGLYLARAHDAKGFKKALIHVLGDPKSKASADACDLADFPNDPAVVKALKAAAEDKRPAVRASALRMLQRMGVR